jgi:PAS domain S-box-containing protein
MHVPGSIYWKDKNGVYLGCNRFQAKLVGFDSPEDIIGKTDYDLSWKSIANELRENDLRIMETRVSEELIETPQLADGTHLTMLTSKSPLYDDEGQVIGIIGVSIDVTDLKNAEEREKILLEEAESLKAKSAEEEKMREMAMLLAGTIAHEMRTPLLGVAAEARWLKKVIPIFLQSYKIALQSSSNNITPISPLHLEGFNTISESLEKTTRNAFTIIDMLLMNLKENPSDFPMEVCSINDCIHEALDTYPFEEDEKEMISWDKETDFLFMGNSLLMRHIFFNLIKNALFYVKKSGNAEIIIKTELGEKENALIVKDTGTGISQEILPHIFDRFFSRTAHGTGIGLAFCKLVIEAWGGNISCHSVPEKFTEFKLSFPEI